MDFGFICILFKFAHDFGPVLLRREYVEKLIDLHCIGDQYKLVHTVADAAWNRQTDVAGSGTVDYFMVHSGRTYCLPLITINANFGSFEDNSIIQRYYRQEGDIAARNTYYYWWQHERDRFTLDDFFSFGGNVHNSMRLKPLSLGHMILLVGNMNSMENLILITIDDNKYTHEGEDLLWN